MNPTGDLGGGLDNGVDVFTDIGNMLNGVAERFSVKPDAEINVKQTTPIEEIQKQNDKTVEPAKPVEVKPPDSVAGGEQPKVEYQLTADGNAYVIPKDELPVLTGYKTYAEDVQTLFPTPGDARIAQQDSINWRGMTSDYQTGDPNKITDVMGFLAGEHHGKVPHVQAQMRDSFVKMVNSAPAFLQQMDPGAHQQFMENLLDPYFDDAYAQAVGNESLIKELQRIEFGLTKRYRSDDPAHQSQFGAKPVTKLDPSAPKSYAQQQLDRLAQERRANDDQRQQHLTQASDNFIKADVQGPKWAMLNAELDKAMKPIATAYESVPGGPALLAAVKTQIVNALTNKLTEDAAFSSVHMNELTSLTNAYKRLVSSGASTTSLKSDITRFQNDYMFRARNILPALVKQYVNPATATVVAQANPNGQAKAQPQAAPPRGQNGPFTAPKVEPINSGRRYDVNDDPDFLKHFDVSRYR